MGASDDLEVRLTWYGLSLMPSRMRSNLHWLRQSGLQSLAMSVSAERPADVGFAHCRFKLKDTPPLAVPQAPQRVQKCSWS